MVVGDDASLSITHSPSGECIGGFIFFTFVKWSAPIVRPATKSSPHFAPACDGETHTSSLRLERVVLLFDFSRRIFFDLLHAVREAASVGVTNLPYP